MQTAGRGQISVWEGASLWLLEAASARPHTEVHSHHAIQLTFSLAGSMELGTPDCHVCGPAIGIAPDTPHRFAASGRVAFLFVEPESVLGLAMQERFFTACRVERIPTDEISDILTQFRRAFDDGQCSTLDLRSAGKALLQRLCCTCSVQPVDARVADMMAYAAANLDRTVTLEAATKQIGLSPSRLRHLFVEETGLAFRTYVLWLRIQRALERYSLGASLTEAAHAAGFSDSAHLSRTFKRTFGVPAASLQLLSGNPDESTRPSATKSAHR